ncbi:MAG: N-acetyl-gamma-glutamyl-phosphate reductase [Proteobacteria bacterium]|nr:MAG: N-acetyl-gamma-glutamyl-phosphate reductase [Pseudomonadota bacterium]
MINVAIVGASGYTGVELARIIHTHPSATLTAATSRQFDGKPLSDVFPNLKGCTDIICRNHSVEEIIERADLIFCAVPHKTAMALVPSFIAAGKKVIDLSADYRIKDVKTYESWYQEHSSPELVAKAVYGLPELYRNTIKEAQLVANPGCYPTSIILGIIPALAAGLINHSGIIADSKSGTSGAGRSVSQGTLFCEVNDGFKPYKVGGLHRHIPEIEQELSIIAKNEVTITFTPHLLPLSRGILSTIYAPMTREIEEDQIRDLYRSVYEDTCFVRVLDKGEQPATQYVRGSNFCDIALTIDHRSKRLIVTTALDNIVKGASGQAVQNMNIMSGFPEDTGLQNAPFFP